MTEDTTTPGDSERRTENEASESTSATDAPPDVADLAAENRVLRERVADLAAKNQVLGDRVEELESELGAIRDRLDDSPTEQRDDGKRAAAGEGDPVPATSGGQPTKVIGKLSDEDGIGVYGEASGSGATVGVQGVVADGSDGHGLYTPDAAKVEGNMDVGGDMGIGGDGTRQRTAGPIAKGFVGKDPSSNPVNAVNVNSVSYDDTFNRYIIDLAGVSYEYEKYTALVTPRNTTKGYETGEINNNLLVSFADDSQHWFNFAVYDLPSGIVTNTEE